MLFGGMSLGEFAVRGFFVLSGFLIAASWMSQPQLFRFLSKRLLRIYPAFIVCSLFCLILGFGVGGAFPHWSKIIIPIVLLCGPQSSGAFAGTHYPFLNLAMWTIPFEFACYLLIACIGALGLMKKWVVTGLLGVAVGCSLVIEYRTQGVFYSFHYTFIRFSAYFLAGSTFYFWRGMWASPVILLPNIRWDISYGLYLYGWPTQKLLLWYWPKLEPWQLSLLALGGAGLCGLGSWKFVEQPFLALKTKETNPQGSVERSRHRTSDAQARHE